MTNSGLATEVTTGRTQIDSGTDIVIDPNGAWEADLSSATAATINEFRDALLTQSLYELDARAGTRYTEIIRAHFNVISPDQRLQRPEFYLEAQVALYNTQFHKLLNQIQQNKQT